MKDATRPALMPVNAELPPGRQRLRSDWWRHLDEMPENATVLAREECRRRREAKPPKHNPDDVAQKADRRFARWCWRFDPDSLGWISKEPQ